VHKVPVRCMWRRLCMLSTFTQGTRALVIVHQVRNKAYFEELKAIGADEVIDTSSEDVPARVKELTGMGPRAARPVNCPRVSLATSIHV